MKLTTEKKFQICKHPSNLKRMKFEEQQTILISVLFFTSALNFKKLILF